MIDRVHVVAYDNMLPVVFIVGGGAVEVVVVMYRLRSLSLRTSYFTILLLFALRPL